MLVSKSLTPRTQFLKLALLTLVACAVSGCAVCKDVPVSMLPPHLRGPYRNHLVPIPFAMLGQQSPEQHLIGPGDVLGIYVEGILDDSRNPPPFDFPRQDDNVTVPVVGYPQTVQPDGHIRLPSLGRVSVSGMTTFEVEDALREGYTVDSKILQPGRDRIAVNLIKPRSHRVLVLREDVDSSSPTMRRETSVLIAKRGTGQLVELPTYENDLLHALTATGGLPGVDAQNEVWIFRNGSSRDADLIRLVSETSDAGEELPETVIEEATRIPLRIEPGAPVDFAEQDIILHDGDVVYIGSRDAEFFYTGGLLNGNQIPLPRDYDVDILGAIALSNGNVLGPAGGARSVANNFTGNPGNIIAPGKAIVLRDYGHDQVRIHVNLRRAVAEQDERLIIQPGDMILVKYTPLELVGNVALNIVQLQHGVDRQGAVTYPAQKQHEGRRSRL